MIQIKQETAFVAVENHGDPIWGGYRLYIVHKGKKDPWQISLMINQSDFHAIQQATLSPMYIVMEKKYETTSRWCYVRYPTNMDDTKIFQKFSNSDKALQSIRKTL